jgi:hypothetical protein
MNCQSAATGVVVAAFGWSPTAKTALADCGVMLLPGFGQASRKPERGTVQGGRGDCASSRDVSSPNSPLLARRA